MTVFLYSLVFKHRPTSNIKRTEKTPDITKNKPLSSSVSKISDDGESSSITIDDENYKIDEGYMNKI
jgi:hypothetical protein